MDTYNASERARGAARVELKQLKLRAGKQVLLDGATARLAPGKLSLVIGPSGAGKTLLLRTIAGLVSQDPSQGVWYEGQLTCHTPSGEPLRVGVVFQHFAIFDEWSPRENVEFALDHRPGCSTDLRAEEALKWLQRLGVPHDRAAAQLSGGQRQRLAIARALAFGPQLMLYDEPTSGQDPITAQRTVQLIRQVHEEHGATTVVVTHDYQTLVPIADAVWLFNPAKRQLEPIPPDRWAQLPQLLENLERESAASGEEESATGSSGWAERIGTFLERTGQVALWALGTLGAWVPRWRSLRWGLKYLTYYLWMVAGLTAWGYLALAGLILGFISTYFTFRFLPYAQYTEPLLMENLLQGIGFLLFRVVAPVLGTILIAARCGAAVTADVGSKSYAAQLDAMRTFGVPPQRYLLTGTLWAFLLGTPLLVGLMYWVAQKTSMAVFSAIRPEWGPYFWQLYFHRWLVVPGAWGYRGWPWWLAKILTCAAGTAAIAYHHGATPKFSSQHISQAITTAILWSTLWVLVVHMSFAFFEFD